MAISNIYTQSRNVNIVDSTKEFAFTILESWKQFIEVEKQNPEVIKNSVYASLILFYNLLLQTFANRTQGREQKEIMTKLIGYLSDHIMDEFSDHMIINVVLHLITLFTKNGETARMIFSNKKILQYIFNRLKASDALKSFAWKEGVIPQKHQETIRLAALALSRLSAKFDEEINKEVFKE